jgi:hypothetical protein
MKKVLLLLSFLMLGTVWGDYKKLKRTEISSNYSLYSNIDKKDQKILKEHMKGAFAAYKKTLKLRSVAGKWTVRMFKDTDDYFNFVEAEGYGTRTSMAHNPAFFTHQNKELISRINGSIVPVLRFMTHEGFHQFLNYFWEEAPSWLHEGYAVHFESGRMVNREIIPGIDTRRFGYVVKKLKKGKLPKLEGLLNCRSSSDFILEGQKGFYAMAYVFVQYLLKGDGGKNEAKFMKWLKACMNGHDPEKAFQKYFKRSFKEIEAPWHEWLMDFELPPMPHWIDKAFHALIGPGPLTFKREMKKQTRDFLKILAITDSAEMKKWHLKEKLGITNKKKIKNEELFRDLSCAFVLYIRQMPEGAYLLDEIYTDVENGHPSIKVLEGHLKKKWKNIEKDFIQFVLKYSSIK